MPTKVGPKTFGKDNLVFGFDLADTANSYQGRPTYNLVYDTDNTLFWRNGWNNSGTSDYKYDSPDIQFLKDTLPKHILRRYSKDQIRINANLKTSNDGISGWNVVDYGDTHGFVVGDFVWVVGNTSRASTSYLRVNGVDGNGAITSVQMWHQGYGYIPEQAQLTIRTSANGVIGVNPIVDIISAEAGSTQLGVGYATIQENKKYTLSTYFYKSGTSFSSSSPYIRSNNAYQVPLAYRGSTNWQNWPDNKWIRISATYTAPAGHNNVYISSYTSYKGNFIAYCLPQVEEVTNSDQSPSPVVFGERTATQGLRDLTGNSTLDLANVSFDSNAQLTFDGTDDRIDISPRRQFAITDSWTTELVFKPTDGADTSWNGLFGGALGSGGYWMFHSSGNLTYYEGYSGTVGTKITYRTWTKSNTFTTNDYHHLTIVYTPTSSTTGNFNLYYNGGEKTDSFSWTFTWNYSLDMQTVGSGDGRYGTNDVHYFKQYNRALTASEVKANYNAIKGRFNI